jgi:hypothetical protein
MWKDIFNKPSLSILPAFIPAFLPQHEQIKPFDFVSGPWGLAQELQTRTDAGVLGEASYRNPLPKFNPSEVGFKLTHNGLKGQTMQRVSRLFMGGRCIVHDGIFPQIQNCRL